MKIEYPVSAGGVVYRKRDGAVEVALCGHLRPKSWRLPKGTPDNGETIEETALREVSEETGLQVEIERPLNSIQYWFVAGGVRNHKTVHFFLMKPRGGSTNAHDPEFDLVQWFEAKEALQNLTYKNEVAVVEEALKAINSRCRVEQ